MQLLRTKQLTAVTGLSRMTIYRLERAAFLRPDASLARISLTGSTKTSGHGLHLGPPGSQRGGPPPHSSRYSLNLPFHIG